MSTKETARHTYVRLLSQFADRLDSIPLDERDAVLCGELIKAGFLDGDPSEDNNGVVTGAVVVGVTAQGRLFLQRLKAEEREESLRGKAAKFGPLIIAYIAGLLSPILTDWLRALINR
jgi:hypothetical protein